jgi:glycosyltransferase involved in cell wall biosynthesis
MNDIVFITGTPHDPVTGGEKYHRVVADNLAKKKALRMLLEKEDFPRSNKLFRPFVHSLYILYRLWRFDRFIFLFPSRLSHCVLLYMLFVRMFRKVVLVAVVHHLDSLHTYTNWIEKSIFYCVEKLVINLCSAVIVNSQSTKKDVLRFDPLQRISVVRPGSDFEGVSVRSSTFTNTKGRNLLYVGTVNRRKGILFLLEAIAMLEKHNVRLTIVGDFEYSPKYYVELCRYIERHGLDTHVRFTGRLPLDSLKKEYEAAHIFVLPSVWEGYGIVLIDAMKAGLPIVASRVGGIPEIVDDNVNGLLVATSNPRAIADAIRRLTSNEDLWREIAANNIRKGLEFPRWKDVGEEFYRTLRRISQQH